MNRLPWLTVERWLARAEIGLLELRLLRLDDMRWKDWRVEWGHAGRRLKGATFGGDGREQRARAELQRRKAKYIRIWQQVG